MRTSFVQLDCDKPIRETRAGFYCGIGRERSGQIATPIGAAEATPETRVAVQRNLGLVMQFSAEPVHALLGAIGPVSRPGNF